MTKFNSSIKNIISSITSRYTKLVPFDIKSSFAVIKSAKNILKKEPAILKIDAQSKKSDFIIVGDIHGSLESLLEIFTKKGSPQNTPYLFLGDYIDRGPYSCEVIILLYCYKCLYPNNIYLIRGNHEFKFVTKRYGFKTECNSRVKTKHQSYGHRFYRKVIKSFQYLPICAIINDKIFCVHGGVTNLINDRQELMNIEKVKSSKQLFEDDSALAEFLWNDPDPIIGKYGSNNRILGRAFGRKICDKFRQSLQFDVVVRGHQMEMDGYKWPFGENGGLLSIFSAPNYCGESNGSAIAVVKMDKNIEVEQIEPYHGHDKK